MLIPLVQKTLQNSPQAQEISGWLLYDFCGHNPFFSKCLGISFSLTRRAFLWIPKIGKSKLFIHLVESDLAFSDEVEIVAYLSARELEEQLHRSVQGCILMEIDDHVPYVAKVDTTALALVRKCNVTLHSSKLWIQKLLSTVTKEEYETHVLASQKIFHVKERLFQELRQQKAKTITEKMLWEKASRGLIEQGLFFDHPPIVAFGPNSANPHYQIRGEGKILQEGDVILLDMWGKMGESAIYGDYTFMAVWKKMYPKVENIFRTVQKASQAVFSAIERGREIRGCDADKEALQVFESSKMMAYVRHRTGHNIHQQLHGYGAHIDSIEIYDTRTLLCNTISSIEPALYLPGEFGIRLENNIYIDAHGKVFWTLPPQENLLVL